MESPFGNTEGSKIVDPIVLINNLDRKFKSHINAFQAAIYSRANALMAYNNDNEVNVITRFVVESEEYSGSIIGKDNLSRNVGGYVKVANSRVFVADKKYQDIHANEGTV